MPASETLRLDPTVIDEIADRLTDAVVRRLLEAVGREEIISRATDAQPWLDAREVAQRLGVSREWVYEHAEELGARRIGSGPRPRLRFPAHSLDRPASRPTGHKPIESTAAHRATDGLIPSYDE
jgi:predicted DNA-binding transcriptional regulator AlpA